MKTRNTKFKRENRKIIDVHNAVCIEGTYAKNLKGEVQNSKSVSRKCVKRNTKTEKWNAKQDLNFENLFSVSQISRVINMWYKIYLIEMC